MRRNVIHNRNCYRCGKFGDVIYHKVTLCNGCFYRVKKGYEILVLKSVKK